MQDFNPEHLRQIAKGYGIGKTQETFEQQVLRERNELQTTMLQAAHNHKTSLYVHNCCIENRQWLKLQGFVVNVEECSMGTKMICIDWT